MTMKTKIRIMVTVTIFMSIGFIMLGFVWIFHVLYFIFEIKTLKVETE